MVTTPGRSGLIGAFAIVLLLNVLPPGPVAADEGQSVYALKVDGLACPFCAYGIEKQIQRVDGVESVSTDIKSGTVIVTMAPDMTLDEVDARGAVEAAGFTMRGFERRGDGE
jgi:mercuric ion binding protein